MFEIHDAHKIGVTAIATTSDCRQIVSGGGEGQVRVWSLSVLPTRDRHNNCVVVTKLVTAMKEHTNSVSSIRIAKDDRQCVSSSQDGTCIVWDLT